MKKQERALTSEVMAKVVTTYNCTYFFVILIYLQNHKINYFKSQFDSKQFLLLNNLNYNFKQSAKNEYRIKHKYFKNIRYVSLKS